MERLLSGNLLRAAILRILYDEVINNEHYYITDVIHVGT